MRAFEALMCDAWLIVKLRWCGALISSLSKPILMQLIILLLREDLRKSLVCLKEVLLAGVDEVQVCDPSCQVHCLCQPGWAQRPCAVLGLRCCLRITFFCFF